MLCLWRGDFDEEACCLIYGMDIFTRQGGLWRRDSEEHLEYAHEPERLRRLLEGHGFTDLRITPLCFEGDTERLFVSALRG